MTSPQGSRKSRTDRYVALIIITIIICAGVIYWKMPKRYCHVEEHTDLVTFSEADWHAQQLPLGPHDEYLCQDGVYVHEFKSLGEVIFIGKEGTCLFKHKTKVCEVR